MKIIGVIPARYKSSRFPGKPLADICGKPMIWWVYQQCKKVEDFSEVYVATDDDRIFETCQKHNINVLLTSDQHQTGTDRLGEVAEKIEADFYVNIQGDEPMIEPETIKKIVDYKLANPSVEAINTMTLLHDDEDVTINTIVKVVAATNGDLLYLSRSPIPCSKREEKVTYYKHLGLYGLTKEALTLYTKTDRTKNEMIEDVEMLRLLESGMKIKIVEVNSNTIGVDCKHDLERVNKAIVKIEKYADLLKKAREGN